MEWQTKLVDFADAADKVSARQKGGEREREIEGGDSETETETGTEREGEGGEGGGREGRREGGREGDGCLAAAVACDVRVREWFLRVCACVGKCACACVRVCVCVRACVRAYTGSLLRILQGSLTI